MRAPQIYRQNVFTAAAATETKTLDSEMQRCPTRVFEFITTGFSGTIDITGAVDLTQTQDNLVYLKLGVAAQATSAAQITFAADTGRYRYLVTDPRPHVSVVMTRSAGSITAYAIGYSEVLPPLGIKATASVFAAGDGTVALPSHTFTSDLDTGLYRIGANNIGIAANGAKVLDIATTGLGVTGTLSASGAVSTSSTASGAFYVGAISTPVFQVDASIASQVNGIRLTGRANGAGCDIAVQSSGSNDDLRLNALGTGRVNIGNVSTGGVILTGPGALATNATTGFTFFPTCAGTPSGVPSSIPTGGVAFVYDTTAHKIWMYDGGAWKSTAALT